MTTPKRKTPTYYKHDNGLLLPGISSRQSLQEAIDFIPDDSDIFICTYPKCGTTWMQNILYLMKSGGRPLEQGQNVNSFIPHIEVDGTKVVEGLSKPRVIKTHLAYNLLPKNPKAKYIYIARNPKDCCVSFYHHTKGFPKYYNFQDGTFNDFFDLFITGDVDFNDYFDHLLSYVEHKTDPNVLLLLYEDMKSDIDSCVKTVGEFLGGMFQEVNKDANILDQIIRYSSFDVMKKTPSLWSSERPKECADFVRKGVVGDWRSYFSEEQSRLLDERFVAKLAGTYAENLWDKYDCW